MAAKMIHKPSLYAVAFEYSHNFCIFISFRVEVVESFNFPFVSVSQLGELSQQRGMSLRLWCHQIQDQNWVLLQDNLALRQRMLVTLLPMVVVDIHLFDVSRGNHTHAFPSHRFHFKSDALNLKVLKNKNHQGAICLNTH